MSMRFILLSGNDFSVRILMHRWNRADSNCESVHFSSTNKNFIKSSTSFRVKSACVISWSKSVKILTFQISGAVECYLNPIWVLKKWVNRREWDRSCWQRKFIVVERDFFFEARSIFCFERLKIKIELCQPQWGHMRSYAVEGSNVRMRYELKVLVANRLVQKLWFRMTKVFKRGLQFDSDENLFVIMEDDWAVYNHFYIEIRIRNLFDFNCFEIINSKKKTIKSWSIKII